ncbi:hypothetical protein OG21DRAFT_925436 [Imleria badia]|nr:hypothetical protein OG21DRAFT_925436 [Imleria badia]
MACGSSWIVAWFVLFSIMSSGEALERSCAYSCHCHPPSSRGFSKYSLPSPNPLLPFLPCLVGPASPAGAQIRGNDTLHWRARVQTRVASPSPCLFLEEGSGSESKPKDTHSRVRKLQRKRRPNTHYIP